MQSYKTFIKNSRTLLTGHVLIAAQGIILMPVIIKTAGTAVYGGYILLATLLGFIFGISSFGAGFKCGRFLPAAESAESRREIFYPQFYFQLASILAVSALFLVLFPFVEKVFLKGEVPFSKWLVFPFLLSNFFYSQAAAYFISTHRVKHFNYATVAAPYISIFLVLLVSYFRRSLSVNVLFTTQIISYTLIAVPLTVLMLREIGFKVILPDFKGLSEDIKLGFPLRVNYVADVMLGSSDRYLIAYFIAVVAVGHYNPGYALGSLILFFPKVSGVVLTPLLSKAVDSGRTEEAYKMLNYSLKGFLLLAIPFIAGAAALSGPVLNLFANMEVAREARFVTPVVACGAVFLGLNMILSNALWVRMHTAVMFKMNMLAIAVNISLNLLFLYLFRNIMVAAFTALLSYAVVFVFVRRAVIKVWPVDFGVPALLKTAAASLVMGGTLYALSHFLGTRSYEAGFLLLEVAVGTVVYGSGLYAFRVFSEKEVAYLKGVLA